MSEHLIDIPGRLHSVAIEKHVAGTDQIYDDVLETTLDILNLGTITNVRKEGNKMLFLNIQGLVLKEISIASELQKQSDWNLTDSTQVDFIKGKPTIYNKLEVDDKLITKQDTIDDLAAIRSGAQAGATAYQKPSTGIPTTDLASDVQSDLATIVGVTEVIPAQASSSNQLADKDFVNSSIATATATYRGAFNLVTDLHLSVSATHAEIATALATAIQTADNNDYCYVQRPVADATPTEIASVERYKFNGTEWAYEYTLNNSGFTASQWAAINSGITSGLVAKLSALPTNSELTTLLSGKVDKENGKGLSANDYTTADKDKLNALPTATELTQELEGKANTADLATVATSGSYNDLSDKPTLDDLNKVEDLYALDATNSDWERKVDKMFDDGTLPTISKTFDYCNLRIYSKNASDVEYDSTAINSLETTEEGLTFADGTQFTPYKIGTKYYVGYLSGFFINNESTVIGNIEITSTKKARLSYTYTNVRLERTHILR